MAVAQQGRDEGWRGQHDCFILRGETAFFQSLLLVGGGGNSFFQSLLWGETALFPISSLGWTVVFSLLPILQGGQFLLPHSLGSTVTSFPILWRGQSFLSHSLGRTVTPSHSLGEESLLSHSVGWTAFFSPILWGGVTSSPLFGLSILFFFKLGGEKRHIHGPPREAEALATPLEEGFNIPVPATPSSILASDNSGTDDSGTDDSGTDNSGTVWHLCPWGWLLTVVYAEMFIL